MKSPRGKVRCSGNSVTINTATETDAPAEVQHNVLTSVTANAGGKVRRDTLEGKEYLVVPMVMLTEGVHAGSNGPLYYPREELAKTPAVWDHKPVVVYHPTLNGVPVSACNPSVINTRKVGLILNTQYEPGRGKAIGRLRAEAWLDEARLKKIDPRVHTALSQNKVVEVSTGLYTDNEMQEGTWGKEEYSAVARNYRADHLAILPDEKGACSVADGAGLNRNAATLSHGEIRDRLQMELQSGMRKSPDKPYESRYVTDVFPKHCVYQDVDGRMYRQEYTVDKNEIKLSGIPEEVTSRRTYMSKDGKILNSTGDSEMPAKSKKQLVNDLIGNKLTHWVEEDRETLNAMDSSVLEKMIPLDPPAAPATNTSTDDEEEEMPRGKKKKATMNAQEKTEEAPVVNTPPAPPAPKTLEEHLAIMPPEMRQVIVAGIQTHNAQKSALVTTLTANANCAFSKERLEKMSIEDLQGLVKLSGVQSQRPAVNYAGLGGVEAPAPAAPAFQPLGLPVFNFEKKEQ